MIEEALFHLTAPGVSLVLDARGRRLPTVPYWGTDLGELAPTELEDLSFRAATALFGHAGIEWDVTSASVEDGAALARWAGFYTRMRPLLHSGDVVRVDHPDPSASVHGVVAPDRSAALFCYAQATTSAATAPAPIRFPGLDPDRRYRVTVPHPAGAPWSAEGTAPPWYAAGSALLPGRVLEVAGLPVPVLGPEQALLLHLTTTDQ